MHFVLIFYNSSKQVRHFAALTIVWTRKLVWNLKRFNLSLKFIKEWK